ncbi:34262_t:CDS:2 [Gigaspora margarita]|uniref:34262_t:CDS:1 n=1 Tax=Gigaspora margarita TaxID=4874 RepID=A0ABN7UJL3_GIGMA|nr:34262_t:CDS:2 [Gigaspora margarita]
MQQQIQRFLEEYFKNPKSSNKEIFKSNKPSVSNGNKTTTPKGKDTLQKKDKTESLDHYEDDTKPVMKDLLKKITCAEIQELSVITASDHKLPVKEYQMVLWKKLDKKIPKLFRNVTFDPNKKDLICLNEVLNQTWENIETSIIAAAKKTVPCLQNRISAECLPVEVWNNQIRHINHLAETKVNKFPHKSERAKSAEIKGFVQRCAEMIVPEQKKMLTSLLERPFNKVSLDHLVVKEND